MSVKIGKYQAGLKKLPPSKAVTEVIPTVVLSTPNSTSSIHTRPSHSRWMLMKDDVVVIEEKKRKMPLKEKDKMIPKVIKVDTDRESIDEESYPAYSCSHCQRHLTSAARPYTKGFNNQDFPKGPLYSVS